MFQCIKQRSALVGFLRFRSYLFMALGAFAMPLLAEEPVIISEFMANNKAARKTGNLAMVDEDNSREDWLEIFNAGKTAVDLTGWHLTDDATDLSKWAFPAKVLSSGQRIIVWASAKDRRDPAKPLHTNFRLDDDGEFLALVHADGVTIAHQFAPVFPPQAPDVSYGVSGAATQVSLVGAGAVVSYTVPADATGEASWFGTGFDDSSWSAANLQVATIAGRPVPEVKGLGYATGHSLFSAHLATDGNVQPLMHDTGRTSIWMRTTFEVADPTVFTLLKLRMKYDDGFVAYLNGLRVASANADLAVPQPWNAVATVDHADAAAALPEEFVLGSSAPLVVGTNILAVHGLNLAVSGASDSLFAPELVAHTAPPPNADAAYFSPSTPGEANGPGTLTIPPLVRDVPETAPPPDAGTTLADFALEFSGTQGQGGWFYGYKSGSAAYDPLTNFTAFVGGAGLGAWDGTAQQWNGTVWAKKIPASAPWTSIGRGTARPNDSLPGPLDAPVIRWISDFAGPAVIAGSFNRTASGGDGSNGRVFLNGTELFAALTKANTKAFSLPVTLAVGDMVDFMVDVGPADDDTSDPTNVSVQIVQTPPVPVTIPLTALITPTKSPVTGVVLKYRLMYEPDVPVPMVDDGTTGDAVAGDGIYTGTISTTKLLPGQMLRWKVEATDSQGVVGKSPPFKEATDSPEYYGTVARDPSLSTSLLPILHWFMAPTANPDTDSRVGIALYYGGEFYDNVGTTIHGQSTRDSRMLKKSHDLNFTGGHHFRHGFGETRASDINLLTDFPDKTKARNTLAYEILRLSGVRTHFAFPVRIQRNGQLYGLADIVENGDASFLERAGFDPEGALYKLYSHLVPSSSYEKKTRRNENASDLTAFATGMAKTGEAFLQFGYDNVDVAALINFLAANIMTHNDDLGHKNYYCYRDSNGTREWTLLPWDIDLSFGHNWTASANYFDDSMYSDRQVSPGPGAGNRFFDFGYTGSAALTEMYRRRLRTLRDRFLPQTGNDTWHHKRFNEMLALIDPPNVVSDADLDYAKWGPAPWVLANGSTVSPNKANTPAQETARVLSEFVSGRRTRLYTTFASIFPPAQVAHPTINIGTIEPNPGLPDSQIQEFFVLENPNTTAVDLSDWTISGGVELTLPPGTVIPSVTRATATDPDRNKLFVARNAVGFRARTTSPKALEKRFVVSGYRGQLSARGESIELRDETGFLIATKSWPAAPTPAQLGLRVTEIHFSPPPPTTAELALLPAVTGADFEYLELQNIGPNTLDLGGVRIAEGIDFVFPAGVMLEAGGRVLVVANTAAFDIRFGAGLNRVGNWAGRLSNGGDRLQLLDMVGESIIDFTYNDSWYPWAEAHGHSLVILDPAATAYDQWGKRTHWGLSLAPGGTPGTPGTGFAMVYEVWANTAFTAEEREHPEFVGLEVDFDRDGPINLLEYAVASDPKNGASQQLPTASFVTTAGQTYSALTFRRRKNALDLTYTAETSTDLGSWTAMSSLVAPPIDHGDGTETITIRNELPEPTPTGSSFHRLRVTHNP